MCTSSSPASQRHSLTGKPIPSTNSSLCLPSEHLFIMSRNPATDKPFSVSDLGSSLPDLSATNRTGLVNVLKTLAGGQKSSMLDSLAPNVKKRVVFLQELQANHAELEKKFFEERAALEARYQKLYEPLYTKRYEIVNGITEVEGVDENKAGKTDVSGEGVPEFWLNAMKANERLAFEITERDEEAIKHLKDIKWCKMDDPKGFKLEFVFAANPFFKNALLTKEYHMIEEDEPILERAVGTEIDWNSGKNLTQKIMRKKVKKGAKNTKPITKVADCDSFFNFFSPPAVPDDDKEIDREKAEELQDLMEQDYEIGSTIRDKIIPHAVSWYTGEKYELGDDESEDMDRDEEDDDDDGDDDNDEDEDFDKRDAIRKS